MITVHLSRIYTNAELFAAIQTAYRLHSVVIHIGKIIYRSSTEPLELFDANTDKIVEISDFRTDQDWYDAILASWSTEDGMISIGGTQEAYSPLPRGTHDYNTPK